jgi:4-hydroxyphenylpyruvate dioxygenase
VRKGIATVSISGTLEEKLTAIARANFDGVEIFENDLVTSLLPPTEVRRRLADLGLAMDLYQPFRDFEAMPSDAFAHNLRRARRKLSLMEQLGATNLLVCSNVSPAAIDDDALAADQLRQLAQLAHEHGFRIAYEALAWGRHVSDYRHAYEIVAAADHPHLGVCLDSFHILSRGDDPSGIRQIPWEKIFFVQLADAPRLVMDVLQWSRHHRCLPGQGGFDLPGFVAHVLAAGYRGPLSLEVFSDIFRRADPIRTATDAMRSLLYLEDSLRARLATEGESAAEQIRERVELFHPPAPPALTGYQFVELAAGPAPAATEGMLRSLGFTPSGWHRSKAVQLWRQDNLWVLTNTEASSPGGSGPALAAIGAGTDDQLRAANRADALLARVLPRRRGPGELYLPSVRVTEGTSLFFCPPETDRGPAWLVDFLLEDAAASTAASAQAATAASTGLTAIDHIALSLPFDQFDEAVLFFRAVLGLEPTESMELPEPRGLIRSRALTNPDGTIRLVLNMPQLGGSTEPALGMHHVAFACDDIFAAAASLRERGAAFLPISDNYYADLAARWELPDPLVDRLRAADVLYDRAPGGGEFFQLYTDVIGDRFFVEVVQRSGGYAGYGAVNAATRMAAQR